MKYLLSFFIAFSSIYVVIGQSNGTAEKPPIMRENGQWADSVMKNMSLEEKIGQLIMVAAYSNRNQAFEDNLSDIIKTYKPGGLIFFQGNPKDQVRLTNRYQSESKVPLLIGLDGEWGLGMRLDSTMSFPYQMALGAIQEDSLVYEMGVTIGKQLNRIGVHFNFAPDVDVNNNPRNPVINYRSFGEQKENVAHKGIMYMKGLQDQQIIACAKHFPGHGDTDKDSHKTLPLIAHSRERLDSLELYPFRQMIDAGVNSIMVGHLNVPALDSAENQAASLSKPIVTDLLRKEMGYEGLIITDAMNMKGVADLYPPGQVDVKVLLAGNDMILMPVDIAKSIAEIKKAIKSGQISVADINERCKKVLLAKSWAGAHQFSEIDTAHLVADLNSPDARLLKRELSEASLTLLGNEKQLIPLKRLDTLKVATLAIGLSGVSDFQKTVGLYTPSADYFLPDSSNLEMIRLVEEKLKDYNLILVSLHRKEKRPGIGMSLTPHMEEFIQSLAGTEKTVFVLFRNAYLLDQYPGLKQAPTVLEAYEDDPVTESLAAQVIFGGTGAKGQLPVTANEQFTAGEGITTDGGIRMQYGPPEAVGMDSNVLAGIDALATEAIAEKAIPGCVILVAKDDKVVYHKAFGYHTYDSLQQVQKDDLYDFASITKISASLPALMKLHSEGKFDLDDPISKYVKVFRKKNKRDITFRQALTHQAGLTAWIPFWKNTVKKNGRFKWFTFKSDSSKRFPYKVADHLYLNRNYRKKIYKAIRKSPVKEHPDYLYSDLSFYIYPILVEELSGKPFLEYLDENFYKPLGAGTLTYNPYRKFPEERIVPTEYDSLFRHVLIQGRVHDEGAAMLNGISGHAGLFGTANDLAKLMHLYLHEGSYGGRRYVGSTTVAEFTRCQFCDTGNRRAIGFDRPNEPYIENGNTARDASSESFGHSGFTGTFTWVDPKYNLVYVFLSNRVYPTRENTKLYDLNTRTKIQQIIYDAILK